MSKRQNLGDLIRIRRIGSGLTQAELAQKVGVSQPSISHFESGKSVPSSSQLKSLHRILGGLIESRSSADDRQPPGESSPLGVWLNNVRTRKGLTVSELAQLSGLTSATIYNIESGRIDNPQMGTRDALIRALGETPDSETIEATEEASKIEGLGSLIDFNPHDEGSLPTGSGVYVFYDISDRPIYVGESGDIRGRIREHIEKFWFKRPIVEYGAYVLIPDTKLRKQIEEVLIRFLKSNAVLNKQHVDRGATPSRTSSKRSS